MNGTTDSSPLEAEADVTGARESGPSKRQKSQRHQKNLACQRCRHRKQKCTETRPCDNCVRSGSECVQPVSTVVKSLEPEYVRGLEERIAELEALLPRDSPRYQLQVAQGIQIDQSHQQPPVTMVPPPVTQSQPFPAHLQHPYQPSARTASSVGSSMNYEPPHVPAHVALSSPGYESIANIGITSNIGLLSGNLGIDLHPYLRPTHDDMGPDADLDGDTQQYLMDAYFNLAHSQFPLLLKHQLLQWAETWHTNKEALPPDMRWRGFFVYMVYAIGFLMSKSRLSGSMRLQGLYSHAISRYLPYALASPDPLIRAQALLLLTIYALHVPAWQNLITLSSCTMRFCAMSQLHLAEMEPQPTDSDALVLIQHRRRIFWCAYIIERAASSAHDLPFSIPDINITVPVFNNIDDDDLLAAASSTPPGSHLVDSTSVTNISGALHVLASRQLRSEIQETLLRKDFVPHSDAAFEWRARMAEKINSWNTQSFASSSPSRKGYASYSWLRMIYYYLIAFVYRPTRITAPGICGDWSMQACCQAVLAFRKIQVAREVAQPWLGLLSQFQFGVTLLYCFFATPTSKWKPSYKSADVPDAIRACSSTLAILAERWTEVECVRDVFEVLARDIPHSESWVRPTRISEDGLACIEDNWKRLNEVVIHRPTLRMIREMAFEELTSESDMDSEDIIHSAAIGSPNTSAPMLFENWDMEWLDDLPLPFSISSAL